MVQRKGNDAEQRQLELQSQRQRTGCTTPGGRHRDWAVLFPVPAPYIAIYLYIDI